MTESLTLPLIAFLATVVAIALLRPLARRTGLTDKHDSRKTHKGEIPLIGGLAIFIGIVVSLLLGRALGLTTALPDTLLAWGAACLLLLLVGVRDDLHGTSPAVRLGAQTAAALIMIFAGGNSLTDLGYLRPDGLLLSLGWASVPLTVFATAGIINAINMCDGLDGLSGNLSLVILLALGIADSFWGDAHQLPLINLLSGAIAGFLLFNQRLLAMRRATVFLGDAGSMMLGLCIAWGTIEIAQEPGRTLPPVASLWFVAIPVFDTIRLMIHRIMSRRSPFSADRRHLHHLLITRGLTVNGTIATICFTTVVGACIGMLCRVYQLNEFWFAVAFVLTGIGYYLIIESAWRRHERGAKRMAPS